MSTLLRDLQYLVQNGKSIVAFNIQTLPQLQCLSDLSHEYNLPVIAQFSEKYVLHWETLIGFDRLMLRYRNNGVYFHLDHSHNVELIKHCASGGFDSVMFDGSHLSIKDNSRISNDLYGFVSSQNCLLEVEIGVVGGVEDDKGSDSSKYFDIDDLKYFEGSSQFDLLALGIGNAHGVYSDLSSINISLFSEAQKHMTQNRMFVLHGGTGMPDDMIWEAIHQGVVKVNISTGLKIATLQLTNEFCSQAAAYDEISLHQYIVRGLKPFYEKYITTFTK